MYFRFDAWTPSNGNYHGGQFLKSRLHDIHIVKPSKFFFFIIICIIYISSRIA